MPIRQTRSDIEQGYLGNTDPMSQTSSPNAKAMLAQALMAIAAGGGSRAATGSLGGAAAEPVPAPSTSTNTVTLYDDRTERPKMGAKDYFVQGLIPLVSGILGGIGGGNRGAMVGAKAGLDALGKHVDEEDKRWDKLEDDKSRMRSQVITSKILRELGGKDGSAGDKQNWVMAKRTNPATQRPEYILQNRTTGEIRDTGIEAWDFNAMKNFFRLNPDIKPSDVADEGDAFTSSTGAQERPAGVPDKLPPPKMRQGDVGVGPVKGYEGAGPQATAPGKVVQNEKAPIDLTAPATPAPGREPSEDEPNSPQTAKDQAEQAISERLSAVEADLQRLDKDRKDSTRGGETLAEAEQRRKSADKEYANLQDEQKDLRKELNGWAKQKDQQASARDLAVLREKLKAGGKGVGPGDKEVRDALRQAGQAYEVRAAPYKDAVQAAVEAENLAGLAATNPMAAGAVVSKLARSAGEKGVLSDQDINRFGGSPALLDKLQRMFGKATAGEKLTPEDIAFAKDLAARMKVNAEKGLKGVGDDFTNRHVAVYKGDPKEVFRQITGRDPSAVEPDVGAGSGSGSAAGSVSGESETSAAIRDAKDVAKQGAPQGEWLVSPDGKDEMFVKASEVEKYLKMGAKRKGK